MKGSKRAVEPDAIRQRKVQRTDSRSLRPRNSRLRLGRPLRVASLYFPGVERYFTPQIHAHFKDLVPARWNSRERTAGCGRRRATLPQGNRHRLHRLVLLHCCTAGGWSKDLKKQMDIFEKLKQKGAIRAHGVSCHSMEASETAAAEPWVDSVHLRINPYGMSMDGPAEKVVPIIKTIHMPTKALSE